MFLGLINSILRFVTAALSGLLFVALVPVFLLGLWLHWFDVGGMDWAVKWIVTLGSPFFVAFCFIGWKIWHMMRTGRHVSAWWTFLLWWATVGLEAFLLYRGFYDLS